MVVMRIFFALLEQRKHDILLYLIMRSEVFVLYEIMKSNVYINLNK